MLLYCMLYYIKWITMYQNVENFSYSVENYVENVENFMLQKLRYIAKAVRRYAKPFHKLLKNISHSLQYFYMQFSILRHKVSKIIPDSTTKNLYQTNVPKHMFFNECHLFHYYHIDYTRGCFTITKRLFGQRFAVWGTSIPQHSNFTS